MKGFTRNNPYLSLCRLNYKLCSLNISDIAVAVDLEINLVRLEDLRTVFADDDLQLPLQDRDKLMEKRLKEKSSVEVKLRKK